MSALVVIETPFDNTHRVAGVQLGDEARSWASCTVVADSDAKPV